MPSGFLFSVSQCQFTYFAPEAFTLQLNDQAERQPDESPLRPVLTDGFVDHDLGVVAIPVKIN
jgi:hypothetical protein